jgi:hypothetical protein
MSTMSKSKVHDIETGGSVSPVAASFVSNNGNDNDNDATCDGRGFVFSILSSKRYVTLLRLAQYLSCVCLALTLFIEEFFPSKQTSTLAEQLLYYLGVAAPTFMIHAPLYVSFLYYTWTSSSSSSSSGALSPSPTPPPSSSLRLAVCRRFHKQILAEGLILLVICFVLSPIALYDSVMILRESSTATTTTSTTKLLSLYAYTTTILGSTLSVLLYFLAFTSFRHYKNEIINLLTNADQIDSWMAEHQSSSSSSIDKNTAGPYTTFFRLMAKFPVSSAVAWVSLILYTSCLPLQGLAVGSITQAIAEATPESSFRELFQPGLLFLLASAGMAVFLYTMKLGFASFNTSVEEYLRLEMTRCVCFSNKTTTAAHLDTGDLSSRYSRDTALIANFIDKNKLFTSAGILGSSIIVLANGLLLYHYLSRPHYHAC